MIKEWFNNLVKRYLYKLGYRTNNELDISKMGLPIEPGQSFTWADGTFVQNHGDKRIYVGRDFKL